MKILIVNITDIRGGAARAAYRLHQALLTQNIDSQMLVQYKEGNDPTVKGASSKINKKISAFRTMLDGSLSKFYKNKTKTSFSASWLKHGQIVKKINKIDPDIVHLNWINDGMLSIEEISKIKAPIVWSLHDMWPFTGGCHYDEECGKFKESCGNCPVLSGNHSNDLSRWVWKRKKKSYQRTQLKTIIGLSSWMAKCAKESSLFKQLNVINIPNPIDTDLFKPHETNSAKKNWNLPKDKKLILFGAVSSTSDPRKGYHELNEAVKKLNFKDVELVIFGNRKNNEQKNKTNYKTHYLGLIREDSELIKLLNAVDVMIVPSLQENLSNIIMESLSCGTPVVAFDIGGNSDMIEHHKNGYLAKANNIDDLANGIKWILDHSSPKEVKQNARMTILNKFNAKIVAQKYIQLYNKIINN